MKIDFEALARGQRELDEKRAAARRDAIATIRMLESRLQEAIGAGPIRGLTNLAPSSVTSFRAASVRSARHGIDQFLDPSGATTLVITHNGILAEAWIEGGAARWHAVQDERLRAEDLEPFVRAVQAIVDRHLSRATRTSEGYERVSALAERLSDAVGHAFLPRGG